MVVTNVARQSQGFVGLRPLGESGVGGKYGELSHRSGVKLAERFDAASIESFKTHFRLLMSVSNMILTPRRLGMNHLAEWYFRSLRADVKKGKAKRTSRTDPTDVT